MAGKTTQDYLQAIYDSAAANDQYLDNVIAPDDGGTYDYFGDGGFLDSTINALSTGIGGAFEGAGTYLNQELGFGEGLANLGHEMQIGRQARTDWDMNKAMNDPVGFITDPSGLTYNAFNLIGSSVPDFAVTAAASAATGGIGGLAVGAGLKAAKAARLAKAASGLEKAMEVGSKAEGIGLRGAQLIKQYAPTVAGNIAGGAFDAATEAGSTYTSALENGATEDEARNAMQTDFMDNIGMSTIQNAISMNMLKGAIKTPLGIGRKEVGEAAEESGKGLLGAMSEAGGKVADFADNHFATRLLTRAVPGTAVEAYTEGLQNEFQDNAVHGYDVNYNPFDMSDESKNQMFMAAVGMVPQGILGSTRRRRVRAEENTADNNIDENTIAQPTDNAVQNENAEPEVIANPEENVAPEVIANPEENITTPENEVIEGNEPVATNEQPVPTTDENGTETPSFATIYNSYINDRDPVNNRTSEQLALDRSNEAEDMGYNTEEKKGQLRAVQDMADTIEALDTNENSPLKQIGVKKPDISKYIKNNFTNDVADTVAGGDKAIARNTLNQVADVLYYRNKKAEPERRRAANQAEAEQLTKEGSLFGLGPVPQSDNGEYTRKSIGGYKQKIASTKNRIDKEHNHFKLAKERQDHVPNESQFAESLSRAVDANDREQFVKDVNQSINELSSYTTTPAQSLNRITDYFHTKTQKDAVRKAFVGYYNDRVNGGKGFKFDINKHLKAVNNIVNIKNKEELPAPKKMTIGQQRNSAIREARTSISNIKYKLRDMEDPALKGTSDKIEERIQQLEDRIKKSTNKSEITHLKQLQNVFLSGKKAVEVERKRREKPIGEKNKQKGELAKKGKAGKRKTAAKQRIDAFNKKMEDEKKDAQAKEESSKDVTKGKETTTEQKQEPAKKKLPPKKKIEVENASDEDINSVASRLWNYHRDHKQFNKQFHKRNGKYHIKDDKGNDYYYSEAVGDRIKSKYNELREAHFKEHPEDKATITQAAANRAQSRKANSQQRLEQAVNNENKKNTAKKFVEHQKNFSILVKNKSLFNDETPIDYLDDVKQKYKDGMSKDKKIREAIMPNRRGWINDIFDAFGKEFGKYNSVDVYKLAEHKKFNNGVARLKSFYNAFTDNGKPIDKDITIPQSVHRAMEYSGADYDKVSASNVLKLTDVEKSGVPKNILDKAIKAAEAIDSQGKLNNEKVSEKAKPIFGDSKMSAKVTYDGGKPVEISYNGDIKAVVELKNIGEFNKLGEFDQPEYINKYLPDGYGTDKIKDVKGNTVTATLVYYKELNNDIHFIDKPIYDRLSEEDKRKLEENGIKAEDTEGGNKNDNNGHRGSTDRPSGIATKEDSEDDTGIHKRVRGTVQNPDASRQKESDLAGIGSEGERQRVHNEPAQASESETGKGKQQVIKLRGNQNVAYGESVSKETVDKALESMFYGMSPTRKNEAIKLLKDTGIKVRIVPELIVKDNGEDRKVGGAYFEDPGILALAESRIKSDIENGRIINDPASAHEYGHFILELLRQGGKSSVQWEDFFDKIINKDLELSGAKTLQELVDNDTKTLTKTFGKEYINKIEQFVKEAIAEGKPPDGIAIKSDKSPEKQWPERPSKKLENVYYDPCERGGQIVDAIIHRIALKGKRYNFVHRRTYFQELMVCKMIRERNNNRMDMENRCADIIMEHNSNLNENDIMDDLDILPADKMLEYTKNKLGEDYAKYKDELEKELDEGDWVFHTAISDVEDWYAENYKKKIDRSRASNEKEGKVEGGIAMYDKPADSDTITPEQRLEKAGYKSPIEHARDSLKTYGREFVDDVKAGKGKYSYADRFWRTPEAILKDMIGGAASKIFDYAVKAQKIKNRTLQRYMVKYSHVYNGLKDNERRALNRAILYCDKNGRDPVQVMSAGKDRYIVYRDGDFIEAYNNINDAKNKLVELNRMDEYKKGEVKISMVAGEDGLKALVYAVKDKNRVFSKKNAADAYAKENYKQAVADMFDDVTTEKLSGEQKAKLADKFTEYRKLMDEAYADMVSVASQYDVKIPPKKQGFFPRYHLPFVVMVKDKMGTKRVTSFYNQSEAQKMAKKLTAEGVKSYVIELSPIDQIRVGINQHDREYLTDDEIKEIEEGKTMSFADMNESLEEHGEGMKLLTNLLNKRFKDGATTVPAKVILKDLSKKVQDNGRTKKQIRATGIIKEMSKYKGSELTKEDVAKILDKCNRHGVFNAHLMHRTDASGYSFNVQNSVYRYLTDVAAYAGNEMFSQEAKKAYAQRFKRDFTLPAMNKEQAYCQEYINAVLSKRNITWLDNMLNSVLKSIPGFGAWIRKWSPNPYTDVAGKILGAQNVLKLGMFNVSSGAVQLSQLLNANAKLGGNKFIGMSKAFRFGLREAFKNKGLYNDKELNKKYGEIFDYIGLYDSIPSLDREMTGKPSWFMDKNRKILGGKSLGDVAEASMYFFNRGDIKARQATAIGAMYKFEHEMKKDKMKEYLKKGKKFDEAEKLVHNDMLKYVDRVVRETNFDYSVVNTPLGLSGLGVTGKLIMQFKKYPFFTLNFLRGNTKEENIRFLVPLMLMGGIFGLPCLDLFDDTVATVTGADPKLAAKKAIMEWAGNSPQRKAFANVAMYGAPSLAGIDISGRIGLNDAASFDAGPTYATAKRLLSSAKKGDYMGMAEALTSRATVAKSLARGGYADSHGNLVTQYDNYDKMLKVLGFRPVEESHGADLNRIISQSKKIMQEHTNKAIEEYKKHPTMANYQALRIYGLSDKRIASIQDEKPKKNDKSSVYNSNHSKEANDIRKLESFKQGR
ncbi:hypothetical protein HF872_07025 [Megasphaera hexanoica]|uniref:Uncharacterized protein n=1 Tax=Megasphaera hexanoica TaxID=1675036 RepID=A0A848BVU7_9FIRM|nr:hypothetical protein [Megasphaera hexanoica]NME28374.1 hypothetical protein [Megasphaera hexanoica]